MEPCLGILGPTALQIGGTWRENWGRPREHALLAALLVRPNEVVPFSQLTAWAWPEDEQLPQKPAGVLATNVTRIRTSLALVSSDITVRAANRAYRLEVDKDLIDYHRFRVVVAEARSLVRSGDVGVAAERCALARDLWRGVPLADVASERADAWRRRFLQNEWLPANILQIETWLQCRNYDQAIALIHDLQTNHPQETHPETIRFTDLLMSALHGLGRGAEATAEFMSIRPRLIEEGDVDGERYLRQRHDALISGSAERSPTERIVTEAAPRHLPPRPNGFIGRTDQLSQLDRAVADTNPESPGGVVILDGMPGVGKTALAVHWGHRVANLFPAGVLCANLDGYSERAPQDPSVVVDDFLIALGHPPQAGTDPRQRQIQLSKLLSGRRTLVILDNARNTEHIRPLVSLLPDSFIVVTSRQQLTGLRTNTGARRIGVGPMPPEEMRNLLVRHLGVTALDDHLVQRVVELCRGLPLAVQLTAEALAQHPPDAMATVVDQLDLRQLVTTVGDTGDGATHLAALFQQSYLTLPPPERRLFRLLPLCPGPDFTTDTACACDGRTRQDTATSLRRLVGARLLEPLDAVGRYRMHDLIAEFAAHRLDTDETENERRRTERRILTYYLHTALRATRLLYPSAAEAPGLTPDVDVEPARIDTREQAKNWFDHERTCLATAVAMATELQHHDIAWRLADPVATYFDRCGYQQDSRTSRQHAITSARADRHRHAEISTLIGLGKDYLDTTEHQQARHYLTTALHLLEQAPHARGSATTLQHLARLETLQGRHDEALRLFQRALDFAEQGTDIEVQGWINRNIGTTLRALDQHDAALEHFNRAEWLAKQINDQPARAASLTGLGAIRRDRGDLDGATTFCKQALALAESVPDLAVAAEIHIELAAIAIADRRFANAINHAHRAVQLCEQTNNTTTEAPARNALATALHADGQTTQATTEWGRAADLYLRAGNTHLADLARRRAHQHTENGRELPDPRRTEMPPTACLGLVAPCSQHNTSDFSDFGAAQHHRNDL